MNKKALLVIICFLTATVLVGFSFPFFGGDSSEEAAEQVLTIGGFTDFKECEEIKANVFNTFLDIDKNGRPQPGTLVKSWEVSDNKKVYTFHLRKGVKFHDGTEWDSTVAKWFFEWGQEGPRSNRVLFQQIDKAETTDEYTLKIYLKEKYGAFLKDLTSPWRAEVIPPTAVEPEESKDGEIVDFIGTGPFKVKEYIKEQKAVLVKNEEFQGKEPGLDKIIFKIIPDPHSRVAALRAGDVDIIGATEHHASVPYEEISKLKEDSNNIAVKRHSYGRVQVVEFNCSNGILKDKKVRQAINHSFDRENMVDKLLAGAAPPANTIVPAKYPFGQSLAGTGYAYDPERAEELFLEAGWKDIDNDGIREKQGDELELNYIIAKGEANARAIAVYLQSELKKVGVKVNINVMERGAASEARVNKEYDMYLHHSYGVPGLPEGPLKGKYHSEWGWPAACHSEKLDNLINKAINSKKGEDFAAAYSYLQEKHACAPLYDIEKIVAYKEKVKDFKFSSSIYRADFSTVQIER